MAWFLFAIGCLGMIVSFAWHSGEANKTEASDSKMLITLICFLISMGFFGYGISNLLNEQYQKGALDYKNGKCVIDTVTTQKVIKK